MSGVPSHDVSFLAAHVARKGGPRADEPKNERSHGVQAWERLGPLAERVRDTYSNGWPAVMTSFVSFADAA